MFVNKTTMEMVYWIIDPMISFIAALRITPNMVTLGSLIPAAGAGVAIGCGWFGLGATLAVRAAFGDIIDGLLARKMGLSSDAGELVDAAVDRYGEMFFFGGLVYYYRDHDQVLFIVLAAIVGSFMVSYTTAKAEAMGVPAPRGAMRRGERGAYLMTGAAFTPLASALFARSPSLALREVPILLALSIVAVVANISVVQRLLAIATLLRAREAAKKKRAARRSTTRPWPRSPTSRSGWSRAALDRLTARPLGGGRAEGVLAVDAPPRGVDHRHRRRLPGDDLLRRAPGPEPGGGHAARGALGRRHQLHAGPAFHLQDDRRPGAAARPGATRWSRRPAWG